MPYTKSIASDRTTVNKLQKQIRTVHMFMYSSNNTKYLKNGQGDVANEQMSFHFLHFSVACFTFSAFFGSLARFVTNNGIFKTGREKKTGKRM